MQELWSGLSTALGLGLDGMDLGMRHMALRAVVVFILSIILVQLGDKRFMGKSTAFDVFLGIVFGSTVSRAITGNAPFFPALVGATVLVGLHWLFAAIAFRSHGFGVMVKGRPRELVRDGQIQWDEMRRGHITEHDLKEAIRSQGRQIEISQVESAHLERNGDISIVPK